MAGFTNKLKDKKFSNIGCKLSLCSYSYRHAVTVAFLTTTISRREVKGLY